MADRTWWFRTRALHAGGAPDPTTGARAVPIYQTTSFVFDSADDAANLFALQKYGNVYSRIANPTVAALEERIASLEGGLGAVATSSGQAAEFLTFAALAGAGDHIVAGASLYGGTITQLDVTLRRFGVETTFVRGNDPADYAAAITDRTKLVFAEVVANPGSDVADIAGLAEVAHAAGVPLVVDATTATPWLCRPIEHGADIVIHSATKWIGGHGTAIGGVVVDAGTFDWAASERFKQDFVDPDPRYHGISYTGAFGNLAFILKLRVQGLRDIGAALSPFNAFLFLQGLETLPLRMERHGENASAVARHLAEHPQVTWVNHPSLPDSSHHEIATRILTGGPGSLVTFGIDGGREAGRAFIESLGLFSHLANIGDAKSLAIHPASTTHSQLNDDELDLAGVTQDTVRLSVGIEHIDDILGDIDQALAKARQGVAA
jgi:O-acetylhomoserine (thiol)-lyase